jgi:hypothetical protein
LLVLGSAWVPRLVGSEPKRYFSRENQGAHKLAKTYTTAGEVNRQDLLQKAIDGMAARPNSS